MHRPTRLKVSDINQHFICVLCDGYLVDATTIVECLHSFCRTCIVRYLENSKFCPVCDVQVHKTKPLLSIRSDATLQDIVYKLIPGLYQNEMQRRREFYSDHPEAAAKCSSEERGEGADQRCFYSPQESISLTLEYMQSSKDDKTEDSNSEETNDKDPLTRYLNCPAALTISNLKKFIRMKFSVPPSFTIEIMYADNLLFDEYTLMDVAYIYMWRRAGPMKFLYTVTNSFIKKCETDSTVAKQLDPVETDQLTSTSSVPISEDSNISDKFSESKDIEKMDVEDSFSNSATSLETNASSNPGDAKDNSNSETTSPSVSLVIDTQQMDTGEPDVPLPSTNNTSPNTAPVTSTVEVLPQSVKIVTTPQHTVISSVNNLKLKFVNRPEPPPPKQRSKRSGGKKGGRGSRNKTVPVQRFARLAPYPPPAPAVPSTCLTASNITPLSQITVGKLVPSVMTSLAPNLVTALVSTTANSLCNSSTNTTLQPSSPFLGQVTTCNVVTCNVTTFSNSFSPSLSNSFPQKSCTASSADTKLTAPVSSSGYINTLPNSHVITIPTVQNPVNILPAIHNNLPTIEVTAVNIKPKLSHSPIATAPPCESVSSSSVTELSSHNGTDSPSQAQSNTALSTAPSLPVISVLSDSSATQRNTSLVQTGLHTLPKTPNGNPASPVSNLIKTETAEVVSKPADELEKAASPPKTISTNDELNGVTEVTKTPNTVSTSNGVANSDNQTVSIKISPNKTLTNDSMFDSPMCIDKPSEFEKSVKNSISAEFSDNDDLGCQSDLVVDEHKMDSSDNEDETDVALREKITAIAEKEDEADATDDTEADSGRASDISNQARSSCDDDIGSPMPVSASESDRKTVTTTVAALSTFPQPVSTTAPTESSNRNAKSNNINHVINNLYRNHEKKDNIGALDLSTCARKAGELVGARPKPVANPVLDIKHKQPAYLGAANKQHTACVPAPKHPTSSPILMHGLTARHPLLPSQLHGKPPHIPVSPFHSAPLVFPSQSRAISTSSCTTGRSTPTYNASHTASSPVPTAHQAVSPMLTGILPCMNSPMMNYPIRSPVSLPARSPTHHKGLSSPPSSLHSKTPPHHGKHSHSRKSSPALDSHHAKSLTTPNNRNGAVGVVSPGTQASYPKTATSNLRISPLHRSASPAPSPKPMVPTLSASSSYKSSQPPIPIYKKSDSYKSYNCKFKGSNLAVINPDPNGYRQKIVIRNLDVKPNNHHNHK